MEDIINQAVAAQDWVTLGVAVVVLVVPLVLKALGKSVPVVDSVVGWVKAILVARQKAPVVPPPEPGKPEGIAAVVPVTSEKPKPVEELK